MPPLPRRASWACRDAASVSTCLIGADVRLRPPPETLNCAPVLLLSDLDHPDVRASISDTDLNCSRTALPNTSSGLAATGPACRGCPRFQVQRRRSPDRPRTRVVSPSDAPRRTPAVALTQDENPERCKRVRALTPLTRWHPPCFLDAWAFSRRWELLRLLSLALLGTRNDMAHD